MTKTIAITSLVACLTAGLTWKSFAEDKKAGASVKDVMKEKFKGDTSDIKKATKGELSKEEIASLLASVKSMGGQKPKKGDEASWKEKCASLVSAVEKLEKGEASAGDAVKAAANCKACHDMHKGK